MHITKQLTQPCSTTVRFIIIFHGPPMGHNLNPVYTTLLTWVEPGLALALVRNCVV